MQQLINFKESNIFPGYKFGDDGSVWSLKCGRCKELKYFKDKDGYLKVCLFKNNIRTYISVHRAILIVFTNESPNGMQCCHNNGIKTDNRPSNLRWDTIMNNQLDRKIHGTCNRGSNNPTAILNKNIVKEIRFRFYENNEKRTDLIKLFNIKPNHLYSILKYRIWKDLD